MGIGEINEIVDIKTDSFGFLDFFHGRIANAGDIVGENDGIGGDGGSKKNFGMGEILLNGGGDGAEIEPVLVDAFFGVTKIIVGKGFDND